MEKKGRRAAVYPVDINVDGTKSATHRDGRKPARLGYGPSFATNDS